MTTVTVCNPEDNKPFPQFIHNTVTYAGVPHAARCQLWVSVLEPQYLTLESEGRALAENVLVQPPGTCIDISDYKQPVTTGGFIPSFLRRGSVALSAMRLYSFNAMFSKEKLDDGSFADATFHFHLLCTEDYEWACAFHSHMLQKDNNHALLKDAIIDDLEGTCPYCAKIRACLQQEWIRE